MVNLVKSIERLSLKPDDNKLLKTLKKQLKDPKIDNNKRFMSDKLSRVSAGYMIAPVHAAALSNSLELFKLVIETKGVDTDAPFVLDGVPIVREVGGVLDFAVMSMNIDIVRMVFENVRNPKLWLDQTGVSVCLRKAVSEDRLDIVELLLQKGEELKITQLCPYNCLFAAIAETKLVIFSHVLPMVVKSRINERGVYLLATCKSGKLTTITLLHFAAIQNQVEMVALLLDSGSDVNLKAANGATPLMGVLVLAKKFTCEDECYGLVVAKLLSSKSIDLDISFNDHNSRARALDFIDERVCLHVKNLVAEAYATSEMTSNVKCNETSPEEAQQDVKSSIKSEKAEKMCWNCSAEPSEVSLLRCRGCKKAWYCGEECQGEDRDRHGPWCERRRKKIEEKHKEEEKKMY